MSTAQVTAVLSGLVAFLAIWAVVLVPQLVMHQHRFGRIVPRRIAATAGVLAYGCLALALVFLPLPGPGARPSGGIQLTPFQWISDLHHNMTGPGLLNALTTPDFEQMAMNVVLFVPLGIFARLLWKRGLVGSTLLGFGVSFLIEITQLTANWGTVPFQYRIADVDDLIMNTSGALLGWLAGALYLALRRTSTVRATTQLPLPVAVAASAATMPLPIASGVRVQPMRRERVDLTNAR